MYGNLPDRAEKMLKIKHHGEQAVEEAQKARRDLFTPKDAKEIRYKAEKAASDKIYQEELAAFLQTEGQRLTAIARPWGHAGWVCGRAEKLWQLQVHHHAPAQAAFKDALIDTTRRALAHHPESRKIFDFRTLLKEAQVKVLNGAPPTKQTDPADPDDVGMVLWKPVLYVAGASPIEGLTVIKLVLEEKVRQGLLPEVPSLTLTWVLQPGEEAPDATLPLPWKSTQLILPKQDLQADPWWVPGPFSVLPPLGRRHLLGHLRTCGLKYELKFFGGTYFFKSGLEDLKVPTRKDTVPTRNGKELVYILYNLEDSLSIRTFIHKVLTEALQGVPVLLFNGVVAEESSFAQWLLEQPSIYLHVPAED